MTTNTSRAIKLCLLMLMPLFGYSQIKYFPSQGKSWEKKTAKSVSLNQNKLDEAIAFAKANEYKGSRDLRQAILKGFESEPFHSIEGPTKKRGGPAGMIVKDGYLIDSWGDIDRVDMTFSVTKSFLSTVAAISVSDGLIVSVNDSVADYVWDGTFDGAHNSTITLEKSPAAKL